MGSGQKANKDDKQIELMGDVCECCLTEKAVRLDVRSRMKDGKMQRFRGYVCQKCWALDASSVYENGKTCFRPDTKFWKVYDSAHSRKK